MFKNILVCLDGSPFAEQILTYARAEAVRFGSKLTLLKVISVAYVVSVLTPIGATYAGQMSYSKEAMEKQVQEGNSEAKIYLENVAQPLRDSGLVVDCVTAEGLSIGEAIVDYAKTNDVDLIAIATHGRSGIKRKVFGSVADFLIRESGLPVLVVKLKSADASVG